MNKIKHFKENGFYIEKSVISISLQEELFLIFYDLALSSLNRNKIKLDFEIKNINEVSFPNDILILDKILSALLEHSNDHIAEIYDTVSYSSTFLKFISLPKIEGTVRELLSLKKHTPLYSATHRIRMDFPKDVKRKAGWHQEIFYTLPETRFLQTWAPVLRDSTVENGTLGICKKSHLNGIAEQTWEEERKDYATRITIDEKVIEQYEQINVPMELGDVIYFDPHLIHRSGYNSSQQVRYSQVGMWNDCSYKDFRAPKPDFISRTISLRENYEKYKDSIK